MLYTGKGDNGTTGLFGCDQRMSKSSALAEALGTVDEVNSLLGVVKMKDGDTSAISGLTYHDLLSEVQNDLFVVQAELAGADKKMDGDRVKRLEEYIALIEKELPPISSFFVSGGSPLGALCDVARTVARRAERRVVACLSEDTRSQATLEGEHPRGVSSGVGSSNLLAFMNRLSSLLYALARLANHRAGVSEEKPRY